MRHREKLIGYYSMAIQNITGHLIFIMAPMASGKGSLVAYIEENFPQARRTVSCTTRERRPKEIEGVDYYFITRSEFEHRREKGDFIEWAEFSGHLYGTLRSELVGRLQKGEIVICEIELQGVLQLLDIIPKEHYTLVYVNAGDWETLKARALSRAPISEEHLALRYERYCEEEAFKDRVDVVINNRDGQLEKAKAQMHAIVADIITKIKKPSL